MAWKFCSLCSSSPLPSRLRQKSAILSFPECCQFSCSSVGNTYRCNATTMVRPANHLLALRHPACTLPASKFLLFQIPDGSRVFRIVLQVFQMVSSLLPGYSFPQQGVLASSLPGTIAHSPRHRRLWEYQPLIMQTPHHPAQTKLAKKSQKS